MKGLLIVFALLIFCSNASAATTPDFKAAVESVVKDFSAAIAAKDAARVGTFYATDAIAFPPNSEMVQGREAIQAFWKGLIDAGMTVQLETVEIENEGNLGVEAGKFTILTADGKTADQGKYVVVWKKENGAWKLYRDIWNTSMAAPPMQHH